MNPQLLFKFKYNRHDYRALLASLLLVTMLSLWLYPKPVLADAPTFNIKHNFGTGNDQTWIVTMGDIDGDGHLDLIVGNNGQNEVYLNDGTGNFSGIRRFFGTGSDPTNSVAVGDLNDDSHLDLVVGNDDDQNVVYLNDGKGNFYNGTVDDCDSPPEDVYCFGTGADWTKSVAMGDINGDGDLDLIVGNNGQNMIYLNDGSSSFSDVGHPFGPFGNPTLSVAVGDLDNDGDLDLVTGNDDQDDSVDFSQNWIYLNDGWGNFYSGPIDCDAPPVNVRCFGTGSDRSRSVTVGDVDGDDDFDLIVGNFGQNMVYLNDGAGDFSGASRPFGTGGDTTTSVSLGDINNDGHLDLVAGNNTQNLIYLNDGDGNFSGPNLLFGTGEDRTSSMVVGDVDVDGQLDIVVGNTAGQNVVYLNDGGSGLPGTRHIFTSHDRTNSISVGDIDADGYLDIVVGNYIDQNKIYLNDGEGNFSDDRYLSFGHVNDKIHDVAVGDVDGDGYLDLVVGNNDLADVNIDNQNLIYLNDGEGNFYNGTVDDCNLPPENVRCFGTGTDQTRNVALGDVDGNGHLDIITGNYSQTNMIYLNDGTKNFSGAGHPFGTGEGYTFDIAIGDLNDDGHIDLIVGNNYQDGDEDIEQNIAYLNDGEGSFYSGEVNCASPPENVRCFSTKGSDTDSVVVGDIDGNWHLDIVVGNLASQNEIFLNDGEGNFSGPNHSFGTSGDYTRSVAVGDVNGDGHLDLIIGNSTNPISLSGHQNRVYLNDGQGNLTDSGRSFGAGDDMTNEVAMGDVNNDGSLDLILGNIAQNEIHLGQPPAARLPNNPPHVAIKHPGDTPAVNFSASPKILDKDTISITYTLFDLEGNPANIRAYYSPNGGGVWQPVTLTNDTQTTNLVASPWPTGTSHTLTWQADADLIKNNNVAFRIEAYQNLSNNPGPFQRPYISAQTFPFRVEAAEWFVKVISGTQSVEGAAIYQAGQLVTKSVRDSNLTSRAGLGSLENPTPGQPIVALKQMKEQPTIREAHSGWAYRTYLTSLNLDDEGQPQPDTIGEESGEQRITIRVDDPLILFNIVASIEWDATEEYIANIEDAFRKASDYLYDVTDGQMAFGQVVIYDKAAHWADADFQFSTKNTVRPYAFIGGINSTDKAHTIRVGRFWTRQGGNSGKWNEPDGYRTLIHEFAHYALYLEDEYFVRKTDDNGNLVPDENVSCTDLLIRRSPSGDATNASVMFYHYHASEFAGAGRWNENCQGTQQHLVNKKSDWETIVEYYGGPGWIINTPRHRGDKVMAGPDKFPTHLLPFPTITISNTGQTDGEALQLTIMDKTGQPIHNALVALYTPTDQGTIAIDQGLSDAQGKIQIYGALEGNTIQAATFDGALSGSVSVIKDQTTYQLNLLPATLKRQALPPSSRTPYLNLIPSSDGDTLALELHGLNEDGNLNASVVPGEGAGIAQSTPLAYSPTASAHTGQVNFAGVGLGTGRVQVNGISSGRLIQINSDYNLQQAHNDQPTSLYSEDGNFEFHLSVDSLKSDQAYATVLPTGYVPDPLPNGLSVIGSAYEVRLSGAVTELEKEGVVRLHYHPEVMGTYTQTTIFRWHPNPDGTGEWLDLGGEPSDTDNAWSITAQQLGIYALMGVEVAPLTTKIYLPLILK